MKSTVSAVIVLAVLAGITGPASAECTVQGWTDGTTNKPIWKCSE